MPPLAIWRAFAEASLKQLRFLVILFSFSENFLSFSTLPWAKVKAADNIHLWDFLSPSNNDQRVEFAIH